MDITIIDGNSYSVRIGDYVQLKWYGDQHVPKRLNDDWAEVIGFTSRKNLIIKSSMSGEYERRIIPKRHVSKVKTD